VDTVAEALQSAAHQDNVHPAKILTEIPPAKVHLAEAREEILQVEAHQGGALQVKAHQEEILQPVVHQVRVQLVKIQTGKNLPRLIRHGIVHPAEKDQLQRVVLPAE